MPPKLIIVGGFLGAGKTTLLLQAATQLLRRGLSAGLITNDQGSDLVDTALAQVRSLPVAEVPAGCFCCRFDALIEATERLHTRADPDAPPEVILAEPVGSCTDLQATVMLPLLRLFQTRFALAPLTIAVDALRLLHFVRMEVPRLPSDDLAYLFARQIEEAELLLLNKGDLLSAEELTFLQRWLLAYCPAVPVMPISARNGVGVNDWLERVLTSDASAAGHRPLLDLDYTRYAQAEARLGWLNARGTLVVTRERPALPWAERFLQRLLTSLERADLAVAHIKLLLEETGDDQPQKERRLIKGSVIGPRPALLSWDERASDLPAQGTRWLLNARVDCPPATLERIVRTALQETYVDVRAQVEGLVCFQPAPPRPQYRFGYEERHRTTGGEGDLPS
jgi:G3E family GTPase